MDQQDLTRTLKHSFGYETFRPLQREIVTDILCGRDLIAILPTGAGKSVCFQLPALLQAGTAVVVSPLIALMKDQVDQLTANGIEAACINSSLGAGEIYRNFRDFKAGRLRLVYVAPERLMTEQFLALLAEHPPAFFAIDEAHCISEWGHDFRPEYRELGRLRDHFPDAPIAAFTATATERVRSDIATLLKLEQPEIYISSFDRPNLQISVVRKLQAEKQLLQLLQTRSGSSSIVYCFSRDGTEKAAAMLNRSGIAAAPYHAGLDKTLRDQTQDQFIRDELQVICATVAFGMGINKPDVRMVIHLDLPKNIEGYYQEIGRAGRDGLDSECILMYGPGDAIKMRKLLEGDSEFEISLRKLQQMVRYAESRDCRRRNLLSYFSEQHPGDCGACDNCCSPKLTEELTVPAQKFLSTVARVRAKSGFDFGLRHSAAILTGEISDKIKKWGHQSISTFGIGAEQSAEYWQQIGSELLRGGYLSENPGQYPTIALSPEGQAALASREPIFLVAPRLESEGRGANGPRKKNRQRSERSRTEPAQHDQQLYQELKNLRRTIASELGVPAYVVFSDSALIDMAAKRPKSAEQFLEVSGVGDRKLAQFGERFLAVIEQF